MMRIIATPITAKDLKPGDLFSTCGQSVWDRLAQDPLAIGQRVYIRTNAPAVLAGDEDDEVYKITIDVVGQDASAANVIEVKPDATL